MNNLEKALQLDLFKELDSLPTEFEEYEHSEKYVKNINRLLDRMRGDKLHKFTKKTTTIILVAAILFALIIVGFAATIGRDFVIKTFSDHFEYSVVDKEGKKKVSELNLGYIPEGFILENESGDYKTMLHKGYKNESLFFNINKSLTTSSLVYDSQNPQEIIEFDGITYVCYGDEEYGYNGVVWNKNGYLYYLQGNFEIDKLLEIAKQID